MAASIMIEAQSLTRRFGAIIAVDDLSLAVGRGEVLGLLGPNGAGKTTTMKMLTGFLAPTAGAARICCHDIGSNAIAARRRLGYLPEGAPLYEDMTPHGFLRFIAGARGMKRAEAEAAIARVAADVHIAPVLHSPIDTLSKGYRRRVALAQALLHDPEVLILDEPTDGLDPNQKHEVRLLIEKMAPEKAIIISTHILEEVEALCSRAVIIDRGKIVADGTPSELKARSRYNGAVTIRVTPEANAAARDLLLSLPHVASVESRADAAGMLLSALPAAGKAIAAAVQAALAGANIGVLQMAVEAGRLDDVFRSLTHTDEIKDREHAA